MAMEDILPAAALDGPLYAALTQLDDAARLIGLDDAIHQKLRKPKRVTMVSIPTAMDCLAISAPTMASLWVRIPPYVRPFPRMTG